MEQRHEYETGYIFKHIAGNTWITMREFLNVQHCSMYRSVTESEKNACV